MYSTQNKPVRAVAYARTSLALKQDPTLQVQAIREFARLRGFELIGEFVDQTHGDRERRKGLDALIADAKAGKFQVVICTALDRIFRSTKGMLNLMDELKGYGVTVNSIREQLDFSTPTGAMVLTVLSACAQLEKSTIAERIRTSLAVKRLAHERAGTHFPIGRPRAVTPELSRRVVELRASGMSIRNIEAAINKAVSRGSIERILRADREACPKNVRKIEPKSAVISIAENGKSVPGSEPEITTEIVTHGAMRAGGRKP